LEGMGRIAGVGKGFDLERFADVSNVERSNQRTLVNRIRPVDTVRGVGWKLEEAVRRRLPAGVGALHPAGVLPLHGDGANGARTVGVDHARRLNHLVSSTADGGLEVDLDDGRRNRIRLLPFAENAGAVAGEIDLSNGNATHRTRAAEILVENLADSRAA